MQGNKKNTIKRMIDVCMTVLLLCLMAYQVTGEQAHEWIGVGMTLLVIFHQILNRKWYAAIFKGKYHAHRIVATAVNLLLLLSFALTAYCGMSMSGYAVPFLYGMAKVSFARRMHLSMSHWAFVLMGLHLGLHIPVMTAKMKLTDHKKTVISAIFCCMAGIGLFLFLRNGMLDYLFFRVPFAFLDYEKAGWIVFLENILMLLFWAFCGAGAQLTAICKNAARKKEEKKNPLIPVVLLMTAVIIGVVLALLIPSSGDKATFGGTEWNMSQEQMTEGSYTASESDITQNINDTLNTDSSDIDDGFVFIKGGS